MEFDEMKKIWDAQNSQPLYVLDEKALHNHIQSKLNTVRRFTNISDWLLIFIYLGTGIVLLNGNLFKPGTNIFLYIEAIWMLIIVVYIIVHHISRIRAGSKFDRSVHGDLDHAIYIANYQIRLSEMIRWNLFPMGAILIFSSLESGKLLQVGALILVSYTLAFYVVSKGIRAKKSWKAAIEPSYLQNPGTAYKVLLRDYFPSFQ